MSALAFPLGVIVVEMIFTDQARIRDWIVSHSLPVTDYDSLSLNVISSDMLSALLVGSFFVGTAIFFRSRAGAL